MDREEERRLCGWGGGAWKRDYCEKEGLRGGKSEEFWVQETRNFGHNLMRVFVCVRDFLVILLKIWVYAQVLVLWCMS